MIQYSNQFIFFRKKSKLYEKKIKDQNEILLRERILDILCQDIIKLLTNNNSLESIYHSVNFIYLKNYKNNLKILSNKDRNHAIYMIDKNTNNLLYVIEDIKDSKKMLFQNIINYLYELKNTLI